MEEKKTEIATIIVPSGGALLRREVGSDHVEQLGQVTLEDIVQNPDRLMSWFQVVQLRDISTGLRRIAETLEQAQTQASAMHRDPSEAMKTALESLDSLIPGIGDVLRENMGRLTRRS